MVLVAVPLLWVILKPCMVRDVGTSDTGIVGYVEVAVAVPPIPKVNTVPFNVHDVFAFGTGVSYTKLPEKENTLPLIIGS